jgi:hypothetical protein
MLPKRGPLTSSDYESVNLFLNHPEFLFEMLRRDEQKARSFVGQIIRDLIDQEGDLASLLPPKLLLQQWPRLENLPGLGREQLRTLIQSVVDRMGFESFTQYEFKIELGSLHLNVLKSGGVHDSSYTIWYINSLRLISQENWLSELKNPGDLLQSIFVLVDNHNRAEIGTHFQEALLHHARLVAEGQVTVSKSFQPRWISLLKAFRSEDLVTFKRRLIDLAEDRSEQLAPHFLDLYGEALLEPQLISESSSIIRKLFIPLLTEKHTRGLEWMISLLSENPDVLKDHTEQDSVKTFQNRIRDLRQENSNQSIQELARILKIDRK